jgi:DNA polymerase-1
MGFTNTLLEVLKKEKPSHMAVVFDTSAPTERHVEFEAYKAHREAMPEDLATAIPYIIRLIEGFNIPVISSDGYEADDVIGTLAKKAEQEGFTVFCMTPDKDFAQLVSDNIFIYKPARMGNDVEIMGVKEVLAKWEIDRIDQVIDILGLWGDAVDNIPGIPGIGEKTAKLLIKQYGSMENIIAHSHELKGKMRDNVENFAQQGLLSKKLATIILDAPVALDPQTLLIEEPDRSVLEPLFAELEFRTLGRRVFGEEFSVAATQPSSAPAPVHHAAQTDLFGNTVDIEKVVSKQLHLDAFDEPAKIAKNAENTPHSYHLADTLDKQANLISLLAAQSEICFDTSADCEAAALCTPAALLAALEPMIALPTTAAPATHALIVILLVTQSQN